tara:strand:+ start:72 stop:743 length:672 start_codon:yes stop_codon:yes gene_type:complete
MKFTALLTILFFVIHNSFSQDSIQPKKKIYHFEEDSLKYGGSHFRKNSSCIPETFHFNRILDKKGKPINGFIVVRKARYIIVIEYKDGFKDGLRIEYRKIKGVFVLNNVSIYDDSRIIMSLGFKSKKILNEQELFESLYSWRVWHGAGERFDLISTEVIFKGKSKQKKIRYYYNAENNLKHKRKNTSERNTEMINCRIAVLKTLNIPKKLEIDKIESSLLEIK